MADFKYQTQTREQGAVIDQGLRSYMQRVFGYMGAGLAITGGAAYATFSSTVQSLDPLALSPFGETLYLSPLRWLVIFAPLALVMVLSFGINRLSASAAQGLFWVYSALMGVSLSSLGLIYTSNSLAQVFFISAGMFSAVSLWGYTTKRDLTSMGSFLFMGLIGLIIASLVNIFLQSSAVAWALSIVGVLVFTGLTAYDTQKIKEMYFESDDATTMGRKAVMGALNLYLDFINLFLSLLRIFGDRR